MPGSSYSHLFGPIIAFVAVGVLVLFLRWAYSSGTSVVEKPVKPAEPSDYGMLVAVSTPPNYADGEVLRRVLEERGIRATLAFTLAGPRLMVWPSDEARARAVLRERAGPGR